MRQYSSGHYLAVLLGVAAGTAALANFRVTMALLAVFFLVALAWRIHHGGLRDCFRWRA